MNQFSVIVIIIIYFIKVQGQTLLATHMSELTVHNAQYGRQIGFQPFYYYETIEVKVSASATITFISNSSMDVFGYLYNDTFDSLNPSSNQIALDDDSAGNGQFYIQETLDPYEVYILVVTTFSPNVTCLFTVSAHGFGVNVEFNVTSIHVTVPQPTMTTYYSELTHNHSVYERLGGIGQPVYYYEAIEVTTTTSALVTFVSNSSIDMYGILYNNSFDPWNPSLNLIVEDDDSAGNYQFIFNASLEVNQVYILVITTGPGNETGEVSVTAYVSNGTIQFNLLSSITTTTSTSTTTTLPPYSITYASELFNYYPQYARYSGALPFFYYEVISVRVLLSETIILISDSPKDMYGYLYNDTFDPNNNLLNMIAYDDDGGRNLQFRIVASLDANQTYLLVVTTYDVNVLTYFMITAYSTIDYIQFNGTGLRLHASTGMDKSITTSVDTNIMNSSRVMETSESTTVKTTTTTESTTRIESSFITITGSRASSTFTHGSTATLQATSMTNQANNSCSGPRVILIPDSTTSSNPAQYRRIQDFYISSDISLDCVSSSSNIRTQWIIRNCTPQSSNTIQFTSSQIQTNFSELYVPARTLDYGIYELKLIVTTATYPQLTTSASAYVQINPSGITANMVPLGTSIITSGQSKDLLLDPGSYSVDPDAQIFNASQWIYQYYCRPYDLYRPIPTTPLQSIDHINAICFSSRSNPSFVSNRSSVVYNLWHSAVIIPSGFLQGNQTYQFLVIMINQRNSSRQATGYLLVQVEDTKPQMIAIGCVISTMCSPNAEYQFINSNTQVALYSICIGNCSSLMNITWQIYQGSLNQSTNIIEWKSFILNNSIVNRRIYGRTSSNFTATKQLFQDESLLYWRFEVVYRFSSEKSASALNFLLNQSPQNGSCDVSPLNGTTSTAFTLQCQDWFDEDGIKDYCIYISLANTTQRLMLAYAARPRFNIRLPPVGKSDMFIVTMIVQIRDNLNGVTEYFPKPITVTTDTSAVTSLVNVLQQTNMPLINNDSTIQLLAFGSPNVIGQVLTAVSRIMNRMNQDCIDIVVSNGIPAASIAVSQLGSIRKQSMVLTLGSNASTVQDFHKQLNMQANTRDYLISFLMNLPITTSANINLQASTLAQFTDATNQLTRETSFLAAIQCRRLAEALHAKATEVSFEDVQQATTYLSQCASNVLTAINGPLQNRGNVLDLDYNRANTFPADYDTDLESEWANEKLFTDENDFSWATIQTGRNKYYQKQTAQQIQEHVNKIYASITSVLNVHLNVGQNQKINTSSVFVSMETISIESLSNKIIEQTGGAHIRLSSSLILPSVVSNSVIIQSIMQPLAVSGQTRNNANTNLSTLVSLSVLDAHGNDLPIQATVDHPIELMIPRDPNTMIPSFVLQNVSFIDKHNQTFNLHFINISRTNNLTISVHLDIRPLNQSSAYWLIYRFDGTPRVNSTVRLLDGGSLLCPSNKKDGMYSYFIDNQHVSYHQSIVFGVRELNTTEQFQRCLNTSNQTELTWMIDTPMHFSSDYEIRAYTSGCYFLDEQNNWRSNGLTVGSLTNLYQTQCFSTHLTTFAGGFLALPSPINWNFVFSHADFLQNKTIYLTVIILLVLYLLLIIFARSRDRSDKNKIGLTILPDNRRNDRYFYQIIIFTGHRKGAGTKSKVHFVLTGDKDETSVRTFADPERTIFRRGSIDGFIMSVPQSLGILNHLRLWHDNSGHGSSASWFVKNIIIRDLQTMEKSHFICQQWFAVEKDDGRIERVLPVASEHQKNQFANVLSKEAYHRFSDGHLWFSILSRPPSSQFTRVQRCTCCFVLLFTTMLLNIIYYDQMKQTASTGYGTEINIGTVRITRQQIGIGILLELLSLIPSLLLVQFFRRIRSRHSDQEKIAKIYQTLQQLSGSNIISTKINEKKSNQRTFPWWCIFIAYILSLILVSIASLFIIARGIEFGDTQTQEWLVSLIVGFFSSICFTQPLKVILLAIIVAYFCRNCNDDQNLAGYLDNDDDMILGHDIAPDHIHSIEDISLWVTPPYTPINRLNQYELQSARQDYLKLLKMQSVIREILSYCCFIWMIYAISHSNRSSYSFQQVNHLRHYVLNTGDSQYDFIKMITIKDYWSWLEESFVDKIRAQTWYNGDQPRNLSGYLNDKTNRLIGWVTIRQLRVKRDVCQTLTIVGNQTTRCKTDYSRNNEEKGFYRPGWNSFDENQTLSMNYSSTISKAFQYRSSDELDTYLYVGEDGEYAGGGYVYEFRGSLKSLKQNLSILHQISWIDDQTRAIIIQMSLYNPNTELFTSVTLLTEFSTVGHLRLTARLEPFYLQNFSSLFNLIVCIFYMVFILYFMMEEIRQILQMKLNYFYQFWSYIEWGVILSAWSSFGLYFWRYKELNRIGNLFQQTNGDVYINLQLAAYVNDILNYLLGFSCFFTLIKLLRFARYSRRSAIYGETLRFASKDLFAFSLSFFLMFFAFLLLFHLIFISKIWACSNLLHTAQMLFEMILMKFDSSELLAADAFLGPICFVLFIFFVVFIGMTMFISIINDSFRVVRIQSRSNTTIDQDLFAFIWDRFQRWIGLRKLNNWEEQDKRMRCQYFDPVEQFPNKMDQFLHALYRIHKS